MQRSVALGLACASCFSDPAASGPTGSTSSAEASSSGSSSSGAGSSSTGELDELEDCRLVLDAWALRACGFEPCNCPPDCFDSAGDPLYADPKYVLGAEVAEVPPLCRCWPQSDSAAVCESLGVADLVPELVVDTCVGDLLSGTCETTTLQVCAFAEPDTPCSSSCGSLVQSCFDLYEQSLDDDSLYTCHDAACFH